MKALKTIRNKIKRVGKQKRSSIDDMDRQWNWTCYCVPLAPQEWLSRKERSRREGKKGGIKGGETKGEGSRAEKNIWDHGQISRVAVGLGMSSHSVLDPSIFDIIYHSSVSHGTVNLPFFWGCSWLPVIPLFSLVLSVFLFDFPLTFCSIFFPLHLIPLNTPGAFFRLILPQAWCSPDQQHLPMLLMWSSPWPFLSLG